MGSITGLCEKARMSRIMRNQILRYKWMRSDEVDVSTSWWTMIAIQRKESWDLQSMTESET